MASHRAGRAALSPAAVVLVALAASAGAVVAALPVPGWQRPGIPAANGGGSLLLEALTLLALPLALTLIVELPVVAVAGRDDRRRAIQAGVLVNALTNPLLTLTILALGAAFPEARDTTALLVVAVLALEVPVVIAEWRLYVWTLGWSSRRGLVTAVTANLLSFALSPVLFLWLRP